MHSSPAPVEKFHDHNLLIVVRLTRKILVKALEILKLLCIFNYKWSLRKMKTILLSILYVIVLLVSLVLLDLLINWCLDNLISDLFTWFINRYSSVKILILVLGGGLLFVAGMALFQSIVQSIGSAIVSAFPSNAFTIIASVTLIFGNIFFLIERFWQTIHTWTFWEIIEFGIISALIISVHSAFYPAIKKNR
jgi:hypothetical protein